MAGRCKGPLAGVKVLDLTSVLMGPYATQIFADLGADVIKIEDPRGDTTRYLPPGPEPARGAMFINLNRGKRSLALDLKKAEARDALLDLVKTADVFIHSMRAGAIKRLKLDYPVVREVNPNIIYANLYGFGRGGRYRDYPAYDDIVQAASGLADLQSRLNGGEPAYLATVVADKVAGLTAAYAIAAALFARERGAGGQEIEVPMFETLTSFSFTEHLCGSLFEPPLGPPEYPRVVSPQRRPYRTKDGHLAVMLYTDQHWRAFFEAIGSPDWSKDPMFETITSRTHNIGAVLGRLADVLATRTNDEWMSIMTAAQVPAMPIMSLSDLLQDPHLTEANFWVSRQTAIGSARYPGIPTSFSKTPGEIGDPGPAHGGDGESVLLDAGFSHEAVDALKAAGALLGC